MDKDNGSHDFDATRAELFEAISHPVRIKILEALNEKPMGFAELGRAVGIESGGHLSFHLTKLRHLIRTNPQGDYVLTWEGKEALWSIHALQKSSGEPSQVAGRVSVRHRSLLRPIVAAIVIAVVALSGLGLYQQGEFASLQQQVTSQQGVIGALEGGVPFTNGQQASTVIGQKDFASNGAATSQSGLNNPTQALFDSSGDLWVVDSVNSRVLEFSPPLSDGMRASLVIGSRSFASAGHNLPVGNDTLYSPTGAAFDSTGDLWVSDSWNSRVLEFVRPFASGMGASLVIGQPDFKTSSASVSRNGLEYPTSITFDSSGSLWIYDGDRVLEYNPPFRNGVNASVVLGQPDFDSEITSSTIRGLGNCFLAASVCGLAVDSSNDIWVGDPVNNRILEFRPPFINGMNASLVIDQRNLVANKTSFAGHGYVAIPGSEQYNLGTTIVFDSNGNLWTAYHSRLLAFKPPFISEIHTFPAVELGQPNFTATAWLSGQSGLFEPANPGFDSHGNLWVPDVNDNRVLEFVAGPSTKGSSNASQVFPTLGQTEYAVGGVIVAVVGASLAVWLTRRSRRLKG